MRRSHVLLLVVIDSHINVPVHDINRKLAVPLNLRRTVRVERLSWSKGRREAGYENHMGFGGFILDEATPERGGSSALR